MIGQSDISRKRLQVSQLILRDLDPKSLLFAAQVSRRWLEICKSDKILRLRSSIREKRAV